MALRALQGPTGGGAPVGGGGTSSPSTIPRWTGPSTLGDSVITQDTTTGVNIRVNAATSVYATANRTALELNGTTSSLLGFAVGGVASGYLTASASSMLLTAGASRPLQLGASNAIGMTFDTSNNVGIGTASPTSTTDIWGLQANTGATSASAPTGTMRVAYAGAAAAGNFGSSVVFTQRWASANAQQVAVGQITGVKIAGDGFYGGGLAFFTSNGSGNDLAERARIDSSGNLILNSANTGATIQAAGSQQGLKLPATPGNADTQTLDAYQEIGTGTPAEIAITLSCGTSGTITVNAAQSKARVTRVGNKVIGHGRVVVSSVSAPLGRLSCVLTGCPQPFTNFVAATRTALTTGLVAGEQIVGTSDTGATPTIYFDRFDANGQNIDAAANIQPGTVIHFTICYSV